MRKLMLVAALGLSACVPNARTGLSDADTERNLSMSCLNWEHMARNAAYPDANTIARHDALIVKATRFKNEAQIAYGNEGQRKTAIEKEVQAESDAKGLYDWKYDLEVAAHCWDDLNLLEDIHAEHRAKLARMAADFSEAHNLEAPSRPRPMPQLPLTPSVGEAPENSQVDSGATSSKPKTWMDTPFAPMIPPVFRGDEVGCGGPAIAPVALGCP